MAFQPALRVAVRDEAHIHAIRLVGCGKTDPARGFAHLVLACGLAQREDTARDGFARQTVQHIALILVRAGAQQQRTPFAVPPCAGVVPGRDGRCTDLVGVIGQRAEFNERIAHHARVGRARIAEGIRKIRADLLLKRLAPMRNIKRDAQLVSCELRLFLAAQTDLKEQAVHVKAHIPQPRGCNGGVDTAGQSQNYLFCHEKLLFMLSFRLSKSLRKQTRCTATVRSYQSAPCG